MKFNLQARTILLVVTGSRAYGMSRPDSDVDLKGVAIPTAEYHHGFLHRFEQADTPEHMLGFLDNLTLHEQDVARASKVEGTVFDLGKFCRLACESNPNLFDILYCRDEEVRLETKLGRKLRENRDLVLSAKARFSFAGYAHATLKRIRLHRAHLLSPPTHKPTRAEFGLPEITLVPADQKAAIEAAVRKKVDSWQPDTTGLESTERTRIVGLWEEHLAEIRVALGYETTTDMEWIAAARTLGASDNLIHVMQQERGYEAAARAWRQYQEWKTNRNPARAELEAKYGFDCKFAAHLVRITRMCKELLTTGKVNVWRDDAEELLAIRNGVWTYDQVVAHAEGIEADCDRIYKTRTYVVPHEPNRVAMDALCVELIETALRDGIR